MKTKYIIIGLLLITTTAVIYYYKEKLTPYFYFETIDNLKKEGVFNFEGKDYTFSKLENGQITGKKYTLVYGPKGDSYSFDVFKNGTFYKNLDTIFHV